MESSASRGTAHLAVGVALLVFGVLSIPSIGFAVITVGLAQLGLYRVRHRPEVYRPTMYGVVAFWLGFGVVAPLSCTQRGFGTTVEAWCQNAIGTRYPFESPSYLPALLAGIAAAMVAGGVSLAYQRRTAVEERAAG